MLVDNLCLFADAHDTNFCRNFSFRSLEAFRELPNWDRPPRCGSLYRIRRCRYRTLEIVFGDTPYDLARNLTDSPPAFRSRTSAIWWALSSGFLPIFTPARFALSRPSPVLTLMSSRSNSARPPKTVSINRPAGVVVSAHGSARDLNRHPLSAMALMMVKRSTVDRASLSKRATTTTSPGSMDRSSSCN
jgi:hypothetical protein